MGIQIYFRVSFQTTDKMSTGNFSVMFALGATLISIAVAAALDMGNMTRMQNRLQSQIDMATLTAAQTLPTGNEDVTDYASVVYDVMLANGYDKAHGKPTVTTDGEYLNVSTSIEYEGLFTGVLKGGTKKNWHESASQPAGLWQCRNGACLGQHPIHGTRRQNAGA